MTTVPWDEEADARLRAMSKDGVRLPVMARLLHRTPRAVEHRLAVLRAVARADAVAEMRADA